MKNINHGKETHSHLLDRRGAGRSPVGMFYGVVVFAVGLVQVVLGNVRSPSDPEVEGSHLGDGGKTFSLSGVHC
jgi:hypothetical protein